MFVSHLHFNWMHIYSSFFDVFLNGRKFVKQNNTYTNQVCAFEYEHFQDLLIIHSLRKKQAEEREREDMHTNNH
jgi:hypothetical protein